ncbi:MAG: hypothetical protein RML95_11610 [Anaerolineae bacterium]|nr:hypothetical protein [Anaerolineae bacterium]
MGRFTNLGGSGGASRFKPLIPRLPRGCSLNVVQSCTLGCLLLAGGLCVCGFIFSAQVISFLQQIGRLLGLS